MGKLMRYAFVLLLPIVAVITDAQAELVRRPQQGSAAAALPAAADPHTLEEHRVEPGMSAEARRAALDMQGFGPDPVYETEAYDPKAQHEIYGGKKVVDKVRPLLELGQPLYSEGPLNTAHNIVGAKNLVSPQFYVYGDWRNTAAINDNGKGSVGLAATRLNLDADLKLTATERVHALFRPFERNGNITRYQFSGAGDGRNEFETTFDMNADTFFFEGDLGAITAGVKDEYVRWDLPFAFGLMPLVYQNGVWLDDAFYGAAATVLNSRNSARLDITNMDVAVFAGSGKVSSKAIQAAYGVKDAGANVAGVTTHIEMREAYVEAGYGYTEDTVNRNGHDFSYHNVTAAFTKRYFGKLSNSARIIVNAGQEPGDNAQQTADGYLLLLENSWITSLPSTLIPYANFFYGQDRPQSLARDAGAGGVLKNTGLSFETDGLTGFPKLADTGEDSWGAAVGVEYLFSLNRQVVVEVATVQPTTDNKKLAGDQYALSARYQKPLDKAWIFRADAIAAERENDNNLLGARVELRRKF